MIEPSAISHQPVADGYLARAPVRISFGGGGTDLPAYYERFGGFVLSAAITRYSLAIATEPTCGGMYINSADYGLWETYDRGRVPPVEEPLILPKAALEWFADRSDLARRGVNLFLAAEVPPGTGLGSSSAMAVAVSSALSAYVHRPMDTATIADLASQLEIERLGMPIGKQDQYASAFGGLNTIEFESDSVTVTPLAVPPDVKCALSSRLLLFATGRSRHSATILQDQRAATTTKPAVTESLHRIKALAEDMCAALLAEDLDGFGHLLDRAWQEKKRLSGRISSQDIDGWYNAARAAGALGGKITGAGGGGFLLLYCPVAAQRRVRAAMTGCGLQELPFGFDFGGVTVGTHDVTRIEVVNARPESAIPLVGLTATHHRSVPTPSARPIPRGLHSTTHGTRRKPGNNSMERATG